MHILETVQSVLARDSVVCVNDRGHELLCKLNECTSGWILIFFPELSQHFMLESQHGLSCTDCKFMHVFESPFSPQNIVSFMRVGTTWEPFRVSQSFPFWLISKWLIFNVCKIGEGYKEKKKCRCFWYYVQDGLGQWFLFLTPNFQVYKLSILSLSSSNVVLAA